MKKINRRRSVIASQIKETVVSAVKASDFCGIWSDEDFGMTTEELVADIKSHRSVHREMMEL